MLTPFSLRACVETHTHTHVLLLTHIEDQNPKILGLGLVMLVMCLVVCLWSYTEGPLLLSWAGVSVDPDLLVSEEIMEHSVHLHSWLPGDVPVWWRYSSPVSLQPRVRLINLSHIVVNFSLCCPSFLKNLYYYYFHYNNCFVDWVGGKKAALWCGKVFSQNVFANSKLSKTSLMLMTLHQERETQHTVLFEQQSSLYSSFVVPLKTRQQNWVA